MASLRTAPQLGNTVGALTARQHVRHWTAPLQLGNTVAFLINIFRWEAAPASPPQCSHTHHHPVETEYSQVKENLLT
jgi:hypothetical protein